MTWRRDIYGNLYEEYKGALQKMGVTYLEDDTVPLGEDILITGVDLDQDFYRKALYQKLPDMERGYLRKSLGRPGNPETDSGSCWPIRRCILRRTLTGALI